MRWLRSATNRLAELWNQAPDRQALTDAANRIDRLLEIDPTTCGESRARRRRILFEQPLFVIFRVNEARREVVVLRVSRLPHRP